VIATAGLNASGRAPIDALLLMRGQKKIVLQKILYTPPPRLGFVIVDFSEYSTEREFFNGPFNIRVLPEGTAYLSELEGKARADLESAQMKQSKMSPKKRFAVGTRVLVGIAQKPGTIISLADQPSVMGEYVHEVRTEHGEQKALGCDLELVPEAITNTDTRPIAGFGDVHFHGHNSRLNVNTTDNSTNVASERNQGLFLEMREAAKTITDESKRDEIIRHIGELEKTQGQGSFLHAYERFVAVLADHVTLFTPFLPALMHIAAGKL
jgi:hypothetical protein